MNATDGRKDSSALLPFARAEAERVHAEFPELFLDVPVQSSVVGRKLGLVVCSQAHLDQRAHFEIVRKGYFTVERVVVRSDISANVARFVVAHEIGHAILARRFPDLVRSWQVERQERFANCFAAELLLPRIIREKAASRFRTCTEPRALVQMAARVGLPVNVFLNAASLDPTWTRGLDRIWLRVKRRANAFTSLEPKLRIVSAHYDRKRFFLPTNQSLKRFCGDDEWLAALPIGETAVFSSIVNIKGRVADRPRFPALQIPATVSAVNIKPSADEPTNYFVVLAQLDSRQLPSGLLSAG